MHEAITQFAALLGTWRGDGHGEFPTIRSFDYADEWVFTENGKPFIAFIERTWNADGMPMHTEAGYVRCPGPGRVEIVAALPTGQAECGQGTVEGTEESLALVTDALVQNTESAKHVDRIVRRFEIEGDRMTYTMHMAAAGEPLTGHLTATLRRVGP